MQDSDHEIREEARRSSNSQATLVRDVVATVMERQAETIAHLTEEAISRVMRNQEEKIKEDFEERLREKEKLKEPVFKNDGNKDQYKHQKEVLENMDSIQRALNRDDVDQAKDLLEQGRKLVKKGKKIYQVSRTGRLGRCKRIC